MDLSKNKKQTSKNDLVSDHPRRRKHLLHGRSLHGVKCNHPPEESLKLLPSNALLLLYLSPSGMGGPKLLLFPLLDHPIQLISLLGQLERKSAHDHREKHDAQGEDIRAIGLIWLDLVLVKICPVAGVDLRCHIALPRSLALLELNPLLLPSDFEPAGEAEVAHLSHELLLLPEDEDVLQFEVTMRNAVRVQVVDAL
jgi:hypothetical protein